MRRRDFIRAIGGAAAAWPLAARAQQSGKVYRIGFLANDPTIPTTAAGQAFADGLRQNGLIEGQHIIIERRFAEGRLARAAELAAELVRLDVDLIVASGAENHAAAKQATTTIPIVMVNATDPVGQGLVASLAHPGGNVTGLVQAESAELAGKRIQLFKDAVPQISRLAIVMNPEIHQAFWNVSQRVAHSLGIALTPVWARQGTELPGALSGAIAARPDALFAQGTFGLVYRRIIVGFASEHRLPSMYNFSEPVQDGGLMAYATNRPDLFRRAAHYIAKILNGAKPAELAIEQPTKYDLVVNLKTARVLGLTIPREFLLIADEVIE
jgi:ABC-type uncharacterized transport system substrate-binding protein